MHHFHYRQRNLQAEDVPIPRIVTKVGTPVYIYSYQTLKRHFEIFDRSFADIPHLVCFSVKANSSLSILRLFSSLGSGFDIVSGGELYRALKAGADPRRVVFSGVGKTEKEIEAALKAGILLLNIESIPELDLVNRVAKRMRRTARVALRLNPGVDSESHPYITTAKKIHKFGIDLDQAVSIYRRAARLAHVEPVGVDFHLGSQITSLRPFLAALKKIDTLIRQLARIGIAISYLDLGGGLGITYRDETPPHPGEYARAITQEVRSLQAVVPRSHLSLILEPGRVIVGNAGILVARVLYTKKVGRKEFYITDAGMNDLIRPALYNSFHEILPVRQRGGRRKRVDVVGPICESGDFLSRDCLLPPLAAGDLIAIMGAGAYGFSMASNYNSRLRSAEVLVRGRGFSVIRRRETLSDLTRGEEIPRGLLK